MFDWEEYLELAKFLNRRDDEASKRSAISRAYYASFCVARNWLMANHPEFSIPHTAAAHKVVWDKFRESSEEKKQRWEF